MEKKILIIDDEKPTLNMFRLFLSALGYTVVCAENGPQGLELFEQMRPAVVMTDVKMPGMSGIQVLERIKEIAPATEVIVITGHGEMDLAIQALNLDATDFINKPIQRQALDKALKRAEERIRNRDEGVSQALVEDLPGETAIHVRGHVDSQSEEALRKAFAQALELGKNRLVLRFDRSASVSGKGVSALTQLLLDAKEKGLSVTLTGVSDNFRTIFKSMGILDLVNVQMAGEDWEPHSS